MITLKNKNAIITGTSGGIGRATQILFQEYGCKVDAFTRDIMDLMKPEEIKQIGNEYAVSDEPVDILVNNAGMLTSSLFRMAGERELNSIFQTNYFSQILFSQLVVKNMARFKRGVIVNVISTAAMNPPEGRLAYSASKAALMASTITMSKELARYNIRVNAVAPGLTETKMLRDNHTDQVIEDELKLTSLKRVGTPEEIANAILFLASDMSSYVTGQVLRVDGGR